MWVTVPGMQGHVAYPHRADNPIPEAGQRDRWRWRRCNSTTATTPSSPPISRSPRSRRRARATNVIPGWARAQLNIRFNNLQRGEDLVALVRRTAEAAAPGATVEAKISGEAFLTPAGPIYEIVSAAIEAETGADAAPLHPWRHLRRPLPDRALPGGGFRPPQRHHAQAGRGGGGGGSPRPRPDLPSGDRSSPGLNRAPAKAEAL